MSNSTKNTVTKTVKNTVNIVARDGSLFAEIVGFEEQHQQDLAVLFRHAFTRGRRRMTVHVGGKHGMLTAVRREAGKVNFYPNNIGIAMTLEGKAVEGILVEISPELKLEAVQSAEGDAELDKQTQPKTPAKRSKKKTAATTSVAASNGVAMKPAAQAVDKTPEKPAKQGMKKAAPTPPPKPRGPVQMKVYSNPNVPMALVGSNHINLLPQLLAIEELGKIHQQRGQIRQGTDCIAQAVRVPGYPKAFELSPLGQNILMTKDGTQAPYILVVFKSAGAKRLAPEGIVALQTSIAANDE